MFILVVLMVLWNFKNKNQQIKINILIPNYDKNLKFENQKQHFNFPKKNVEIKKQKSYFKKIITEKSIF